MIALPAEVASDGFAQQSALDVKCSRRVVMAAGVWLCIYMADLRVVMDQPLHLLIGPALIAATIQDLNVPSRRVLWLFLLLSSCCLYQSVIDGALMARPAFEIGFLTYIFSLRSVSCRHGSGWIAASLAVFYVLTILLFLLTLVSPEAREIRALLYHGSEKRAAMLDETVLDMGAEVIQQGGLSFYLHTYGYQLAGACGFFVAVGILQSVRWPAVLAIGATTIAVLMSGQRAVFLGLAGVLAVMGRKSPARSAVVVCVGIAVGACMLASWPELDSVRKYNTISRLDEQRDLGARLRLQAWGVETAMQFPLGLRGAGVKFESVAPVFSSAGPVAPHNGYVTRLLFYGWPMVGFAAAGFGMIGCWALSSLGDWSSPHMSQCEIATLGSVIAVLLHAMFHNASFITFSSETIVVMFAYAKCCDVRCLSEANSGDAEAWGGNHVQGWATPCS